MKQFLKIIILNIWGSLKRANSLPALSLLLVSACLLLVGSSAAVGISDTHTSRSPSRMAKPHVAAILTQNLPIVTGSPVHKVHHKVNKNVVAGLGDSTQPGNQAANPSVATLNRADPSGQVASLVVTLAPSQPSCQQGSPAFVVPAALVTLPVPLAADNTVTWYWETRIDSGTDTSSQPPIPVAQASQSMSAGSTQTTLTASDPSQPLLVAPVNSTYAYSFRLHVIIGQASGTSPWQSVSQATNANGICQQN